MAVYMLRQSTEYPDYYYVLKCRTREEALASMDPLYSSYRFIEGNELRLQLTEKEEQNEA